MKVSIITPTYNRADLIERAIQSIVSQTYTNFELIIVDDASTDNTYDIVRPYLVDERIRYYSVENNGGVNIARNIGLSHISPDSEIITFLDSDDEYLSNALELIVQEFKSQQSINFFRFGVKYDNGKLANNQLFNNKTLTFEQFVVSLFDIGEWVCAFRTDNIRNKFKFYEDINAFEIASFLNLARDEKQYFSAHIIRIYHTGHESITTEKMSSKKILQMKAGYSKILSAFGKDIKGIDRKIYSKIQFALSLYTIKNREFVEGIKLNFAALSNSPFDLRFFRNILAIIRR